MAEVPASTAVAAVPLPKRKENGSLTSKAPVWPLVDAPGAQPAPLQSKCARHNREGGVCCRDLKGDDERTLIDPDIVRDIIIGLSDGLTVPFALTAGLSSLGTSRLVVLGGVAELIAGAISMGIGGFLSAQAERDHYRYLRRVTSDRVLRSCSGEMEREVHAVLGPIGVDEKTSRQVANSLKVVEIDSNGKGRRPGSSSSSSEEDGSLVSWERNVGLTAFLLKFGEGLEEVPTSRLYISAFTIGMGYLLGGIIPLIPYFFEPHAMTALMYSAIITGVVLLVFGAVKARVTGAGAGLKGYIWGAVSTLAVGGAAAAAAFGIVRAIEAGGDDQDPGSGLRLIVQELRGGMR